MYTIIYINIQVSTTNYNKIKYLDKKYIIIYKCCMSDEKIKPKPIDATLKEQLRELYVQGIQDVNGNRQYPSIEQLATDHNVAKVTLFRKSSSENWKGQRALFEQRLAQKKDAERVENLVKESVEFDSRNLNIAKALQGQVTHLIRLAAQEIQDNELRRPFSPVALERLAGACMSIQKIGRLALGETTENTQINGTINNESAIRTVHEFIDELTDLKRKGSGTLN